MSTDIHGSTSAEFRGSRGAANVTLTTENAGRRAFRVEIHSGSQFRVDPSAVHINFEAQDFANRLRRAVSEKLGHPKAEGSHC